VPRGGKGGEAEPAVPTSAEGAAGSPRPRAQPRDTMSQAQPYGSRNGGSPAAGARRNDSQDYLLLDAEPSEESALPPYAFYPV